MTPAPTSWSSPITAGIDTGNTFTFLCIIAVIVLIIAGAYMEIIRPAMLARQREEEEYEIIIRRRR